ncbi:MAG: hypothetical protein K8Q89_06315 [Nitrosarchaeum sp.]|nr:hypothetical protein [Nitrosarchaeum sp.]
MNFKIIAILFLIVLVSLSVTPAFAHFEHLPHNNGGGEDLGRYYVNQALDPEYAKPGQPAHIEFSIQDDNGHDVSNVMTAVEVYDGITGQRLELFPWQLHSSGDFEVHYTFEKLGNYVVVISLADENTTPDHIIPPRNLLSSLSDCQCQRAVFNISITDHIGTVWNTVMTLAIFIPLTVFGSVLAMHFWNLKKKGIQPTTPEVMKYLIMLLAVAGGIIHLGVYADHGSLRIEYSIFLLAASIIQVGFGIFYVLMTLLPPSITSKQSILQHYNKTLLLNLVGLVGTSILVGLYIYVLIFPPPLSPDGRPEILDYDGAFSKSVEITTMIGILYLMIYERRKKKILLGSIPKL